MKSREARHDQDLEDMAAVPTLLGRSDENETLFSGRISGLRHSGEGVRRGPLPILSLKPHWKVFIAAAGLALFVLLATSIGHRPTVAVRLAYIYPAVFQITIPATGEMQRPRVAVIPTLVGGNIGQILVHAGMLVHSGQVLATVENPELESNVLETRDAYLEAVARAEGVSAANAALPAEHRSSIEQAQVAVMQARAMLAQTKEDQATGVQSGPGYSTTPVEQQRLEARAGVRKAENERSDAERIYKANQELFTQKAISRDALEESRIRFDNANTASMEAVAQDRILDERLAGTRQVFSNRVRTAEKQLQQAQAALDTAVASAAGDKVGELQAARDDAAHAKEAYLFARTQVDNLRIVAPCNGTIQRVASEPNRTLQPLVSGDAVQSGQELFTIARSSGFIVRASIDEQDVAQVRVGARAIISSEDFGDKTLTGRVVEISPTAEHSSDPSNTTGQVEATIAINGTLPFLRDGMSANADIVTIHIPHAIAVSNEAIHHDGKRTYVFIVRNENAVKKFVTTGRVSNTQTLIINGLHEGDIVVDDNNPGLLQGVGVTPLLSPSPGFSPASTS